MDNLTAPESWTGHGISDDTFAVVANMFGVIDHNTVGGATLGDNGVDFVNVGHGQWAGVGSWGDNSWASPDTFGSAQALFLENNTFTNSFGTDMDRYGTAMGGGRVVCRFNVFNSITAASTCTDHGTDTIGRVRGGRQIEFYNNTGTCPSSWCNTIFGERSATAIVFGNSITGIGGGETNSFVAVDTQRRWRLDSWGPCDGSDAWDVNDSTVYYSGTIAAVVSTGSNYTVVAVGTPGWTATQLNSINGAPYSFHDVTQGFGFEIGSNALNSITSFTSCNGNGCSNAPASGDAFEVRRATVCMDQPGRGQGLLVEGGDGTASTEGFLTPRLVSTGNPGSVAETLDPMYEFNDSAPVAHGQFSSNDSQGIIAGRDYYAQYVGQTAQTSSTSPFNGTTTCSGSNSCGTGWGTLANRPPSCTTGVGYWATDQGNWNTSGSGGQGELFVCTATNTWTLHYTPYAYPHPLIAAGSATTPPPSTTMLPAVVH